MTNELTVIIEESGLEKTQGQVIIDNFSSLLKSASEWEKKANSIVITDASQIELMSEAREARLALKDIRVDAEKTRKSLKEKALREGKAIDGIANVIKALIVPLEEHLEKQEKYIENIEIERKQKLNEIRTTELLKYVASEDLSLYNYLEMSDDVFANLLQMVKTAYLTKQEEVKKIEEARLEEVKRKEEADKQMRIENEKLRKEKEVQIKKDNEAAEQRRLEQKKNDDEHLKELEKERAEKAKLAAELKKQEDEKHAAIKKEQEERKAEIEKERLAKLAPEKDKLLRYAELIRTIKAPDELSKAGLEIVKEVEQKLLEISQEIKIKIKNL